MFLLDPPAIASLRISSRKDDMARMYLSTFVSNYRISTCGGAHAIALTSPLRGLAALFAPSDLTVRVRTLAQPNIRSMR